MKIVIIIPTYNEQDSIGALVDAVRTETSLIKNHQIELLIIDGNSPDKTATIVQKKQSIDPSIHLIIEKQKKGLGAAYIHGMNYAMKTLGAEAVMEFDGDFQHDPKDIPKLIKQLDLGFEQIIGSRYIEGGTIPATWPLYRKLLSKIGNRIAKIGLSLPTKDNTSGFKLTLLSKFADKLPLNEKKILSLRHAYKIHLLHDLIYLDAKTIEVPINFLDRDNGLSKSTFSDVVESLKVVIILRWKKFLKI